MYYELNANKIYYNGITFSARQVIGRSSFLANYTFSKVEDYGQAGTRVNRDPGFATPTADNLAHTALLRTGTCGTGSRSPRATCLPEPRRLDPAETPRGRLADHRHGHPAVAARRSPCSPTRLSRRSSGPTVRSWGCAPNSGDYNADGVNFDFPNAPAERAVQLRSAGLHQRRVPGGRFPQPAPGQEGNLRPEQLPQSRVHQHRHEPDQEQPPHRARQRAVPLRGLQRAEPREPAGGNGNLASSTFGRSTSTYDPRIIQLGARVTF